MTIERKTQTSMHNAMLLT